MPRSIEDEYLIELTAFGYEFWRNTEAELMASCGDIEITWEEKGDTVTFTAWDASEGFGYEYPVGHITLPANLEPYGGDVIKFNEWLQLYRKKRHAVNR